mmetsp:Transcript_6814/g.11262  ORF Transcript_6814/g.11262 Transcript_6814/m.11262 type:complete len:125 (-) Transcript_6814:64-438(-)
MQPINPGLRAAFVSIVNSHHVEAKKIQKRHHGHSNEVVLFTEPSYPSVTLVGETPDASKQGDRKQYCEQDYTGDAGASEVAPATLTTHDAFTETFPLEYLQKLNIISTQQLAPLLEKSKLLALD